MLVGVNKVFVSKSLSTTPSNVLPLHLKQTFPPIIWIFTEGKGDGIKSFYNHFYFKMNGSQFCKNLFVIMWLYVLHSTCVSNTVKYLGKYIIGEVPDIRFCIFFQNSSTLSSLAFVIYSSRIYELHHYQEVLFIQLSIENLVA